MTAVGIVMVFCLVVAVIVWGVLLFMDVMCRRDGISSFYKRRLFIIALVGGPAFWFPLAVWYMKTRLVAWGSKYQVFGV
jgi:hypothetical protein